MKTDTLITILIAVAGVSFLIWLINRYKKSNNINTNYGTVNTSTETTAVAFRQPVMPNMATNMSIPGGMGQRVTGGGGVTH